MGFTQIPPGVMVIVLWVRGWVMANKKPPGQREAWGYPLGYTQ
jgi:hypothetical protein